MFNVELIYFHIQYVTNNLVNGHDIIFNLVIHAKKDKFLIAHTHTYGTITLMHIFLNEMTFFMSLQNKRFLRLIIQSYHVHVFINIHIY